MSSISNYWRIITPASRKQLYTTLATDAYDPRTTDVSSLTAVQWYSQVLRGPGSRMQMYKQFEAMDADIDIARSLDIIAEEISTKDTKTKLPFEIEYQKEDNEDVSDTTSITLRQAVRQWVAIQELNRRIFSIARTLIKYGDCFFRKVSDTKKWVYIDPSLVHGVEVNEFGDKIAYHVKRPQQPQVGTYNMRQEQFDVVPADAMIHFSLSDDMGDSAPFGPSILRPVYRVYRQLSMLEDAAIIYTIVRAPERRVFYIDTGNMPPQRVKIYLEQIKNEMRQKRSPTSNQGGKDTVDGAYDPQSIQEDMFFPVNAAGRGSRVETLPAGVQNFAGDILKQFQEKVYRGLRIPTSYLSGSDGQNAQYNDGKVGIAYIEEMRFANFIMRIQDRIETLLDEEFKIYLKVVGLKIDDDLFNLKLPDPANFALYRQAALDADLISSFNNIESSKYLSRRFILKRYLGLTDDEIQMNEVMVKEERAISETSSVPPLQQMYDPAVYENRDAVKVKADEEGGGDFGGEMDSNYDGGASTDDLLGTGGGEPEAEPAAEPAPEEPAA